MSKLLPVTVFAAFTILVASAPAAVAAPASFDQTGTEVHQTVVAIGDLDLLTPAGVATAERRIHRAADEVCGAEGNLLSPAAHCRQAAISGAERALHTQFAVR